MLKKSNTHCIILAAGKGKRMKCGNTPKCLVPFNQKPMILHVIENVKKFAKNIVVVVGYEKDKIIRELDKYKFKLKNNNLIYIEQKEQLGTGHAVKVCKNYFSNLEKTDDILVICGDTPLINSNIIDKFISNHIKSGKNASILTKKSKKPNKAGRVIRKNGEFVRTIEFKDIINPEIKNLKEIGVGTIICKNEILFETLNKINNDNIQKEYYLPDVINILAMNKNVNAYISNKIPDLYSFNTKKELEDYYKLNNSSKTH